MKIPFFGALRRAAAGALCLSLLFTALAPAAPVWAAGDGTLAVSEAASAEDEAPESDTAPVQVIAPVDGEARGDAAASAKPAGESEGSASESGTTPGQPAAPADGEVSEDPTAPAQANNKAAEDSAAPVQPAAPANSGAADASAPEALAAGGELLLVASDSASSLEGTQLRDGETLEGAASALHLTLCRGDTNHPLLFDEAEFTLVKPGTDEPVPADAFYRYAGGDWGAYAQFFFSTTSTDAGYGPLQDYFAALAPDFGVDVLATVKATGETLRAHIAYSWTLSHDSYTSEFPAWIERTGEDTFTASVRVSLSDYANGLTARLDWLGENFRLEGGLAKLFTLDSVEKGVLNFSAKPGADPSQGEAVDGTLAFTRKTDGLEDSIPLRYTPAPFSRDLCWAVVENGKISDPEQLDLRVGQSGSVELRLYDTLNPTAADTPLAISEELFQSIQKNSTLSDGLKLEQGEDGASLRLVYDLTAADVKADPYRICVQLDGIWAYLGIKVDNSAWVLAQGSLLPWPSGSNLQQAGFTRTEFNPYQPLSLNSLLEQYAVVPLKDGKPAASRAELEAFGLTLEGAASDRIEAMAIPYREDAASSWQTVWAWVIRPMQQQSEERTLSLRAGGGALASIPVKISGFERLSFTPAGDGPTILGGQEVIQRTASDVAQRGAVYQVGNQSGPLVLTAAPQVSGPAAGNVSITWEAGLSAFRLDYTGRQVPGDATITVQTEKGSASMVIRFAAFGSSATYYSNGTDSMWRPYNETIGFTEDLAALSSSVSTSRTTADSFELYLFSSQYIGKENGMDTGLVRHSSFATELVKSVTFASSDEDILKIAGQIGSTTEKDPVMDGNGYTNPEGKCFGIRLVPGGKAGSCDVTATVELYIPSLNDPFGASTTYYNPETVTIGLTFEVSESGGFETVIASPDTLESVLDGLGLSPQPTVVLLAPGEYPMDLNIQGKNVILRSADANDPATFTGKPGAEGGYILTVSAASPEMALENITVDGGGKRGGIAPGEYTGGTSYPLNIRSCAVRNCTTGVAGGTVNGGAIIGCDVGAMGGPLRNVTLSGNKIAVIASPQWNNDFSLSIRFCSFIGNGLDVDIRTPVLGPASFTLDLPQNHWDGNSILKYAVHNSTGTAALDKPVTVYTSPYYVDAARTALSVDAATAQTTGGALLLPLEKSESGEGSLLVNAAGFAAIQAAGLAASFPIVDVEARPIATWEFARVTDPSIDTDLNVSDTLSDKAQQAVDALPESEQAKVVQEVNLSHNGALPGRATLSIKATELPAGGVDELYLYWVKPDGTIVPAEVVEVRYDAATGCYVITVDHCSEYIITSGTLTAVSVSPTPAPTAGPEASPAPTAAPTASPLPSAVPGANSAPAQSQLYSAQKVMDAFKAQPRDVTLDVTVRSDVSQTAFSLLLQRPGTSLRLQGDGYAWVFAADDLLFTELPGGVFDASVTLAVAYSQAARIEQTAAGQPWFGLDTGFSGQLPGPARLELKLSAAEFAGMTCGLYWLPEEDDAQRIATVDVASDGTVSLPLDHCSVYFLVAEEPAAASPAPAATPEPAPAPSETPAAAVSSGFFGAGPLLWCLAGAAVLAAAGVLLRSVFRRRGR